MNFRVFQHSIYFAILSLSIVGCTSLDDLKNESKAPECWYMKYTLQENRKIPPSEDFQELLNGKFRGLHRIVDDDVWFYTETASKVYFYSVYGKSGLQLGWKDANGADMTIKDFNDVGLWSNVYDRSGERHIMYKAQKRNYEILNPDSANWIPKPYIAKPRPSYCSKELLK